MKICNHERCKWNQFGGGYCRIHQYKRIKRGIDDKKNEKGNNQSLQKTLQIPLVFKRVSRRIRQVGKKQADKNKQKAELSRRDRELWAEIWVERPHSCYNCDCYLGEEPLTLFFDHILEKSTDRYAHLRYVKENICLLCWDCHTNKSMIKKLIKLREEIIKKLMQ